jgi:hypothetical protein
MYTFEDVGDGRIFLKEALYQCDQIVPQGTERRLRARKRRF